MNGVPGEDGDGERPDDADADFEAQLDGGDVLAPGDLVAVEDADGPAPLPAFPADAIARARGFAAASRAASTRAKYEATWDSFAHWCATHGHDALPAHPGTVAVFLAEEAARGCSPSWINLKMAAIGWAHRRAGRTPPTRRPRAVLPSSTC